MERGDDDPTAAAAADSSHSVKCRSKWDSDRAKVCVLRTVPVAIRTNYTVVHSGEKIMSPRGIVVLTN